jgi:hypothetical protein
MREEDRITTNREGRAAARSAALARR